MNRSGIAHRVSEKADMLVITPLSADSLAKMIWGHVEGAIGPVVRAWDVKKRIVDEYIYVHASGDCWSR